MNAYYLKAKNECDTVFKINLTFFILLNQFKKRTCKIHILKLKQYTYSIIDSKTDKYRESDITLVVGNFIILQRV